MECQTLYINPELDTLHVVGSTPFAQFAHDIWSRDPLGIGLVNFAIDTERTEIFAERNCSGDLRALRQVVSRLKRVIFMKSAITCSRPAPPSRPTMAAIPSFARQPDPRPIQTELKRVRVGGLNPRWGIYCWFQLIANLQLENPIDYRFMPTHATDSCLRNRDDTTKYFQRKDFERTVCMDEDCPHRAWEETQHLPLQAVGFWLFPLESLGPVPHPDDDPSEYPPWLGVRHDVDMSKYNPELCLQYLP
ncbi:hypothetical protein FALBO_3733 [Fusarium albosuccineum]|uniref:Uncharacterized protein n=1 Tax=Fusarium albosuccineum TaxID=1237068 RepID=A0A8H4PGY6_9HYPO|nr:hypothetical protein FALBO_3733 [Fusarium albosuccineum]